MSEEESLRVQKLQICSTNNAVQSVFLVYDVGGQNEQEKKRNFQITRFLLQAEPRRAETYTTGASSDEEVMASGKSLRRRRSL